MNGSEAT